MRKAELAVDKKDDDLARAALERAVSFQLLADNFDQQIANHHTQVESMKSALKRLELKLEEARARADLLIVQHRRSRATQRGAVDLDEASLDLTARFLELVDTLGELRFAGSRRAGEEDGRLRARSNLLDSSIRRLKAALRVSMPDLRIEVASSRSRANREAKRSYFDKSRSMILKVPGSPDRGRLAGDVWIRRAGKCRESVQFCRRKASAKARRSQRGKRSRLRVRTEARARPVRRDRVPEYDFLCECGRAAFDGARALRRG
jgi:phage shock protein A